jgi:cytochrome P450
MMSGQGVTEIAGALPPDLGEIPMQRIQRNPLRFLEDVTRDYPDIATYRTNGWRVVLLNHPDAVRYVLKSNWHNYNKEGTPDLMMLRPMLGAGLMTVDGDEWFHQRRYLQPAFHHGIIDGYVPDMVGEIGRFLDRLASDARDTPIDLAPRLSHLTLAIVAKTLFGIDLAGQADEFGHAVDVLNAVMAHFDPWNQEALIEFQKAQSVIGRVVRSIVEMSPPGTTENMLSVLRSSGDNRGCPLADKEISDQIFTFLMAGHETTAKSLTWALYLLARHPGVQQRCRDEAGAVIGDAMPDPECVDRLDYTWQVLQEAMRLYPPVWSMSRKAIGDDKVEGYHVAAGSLVIVSPYTLHRRPDFWPDPERFDPNRFSPEAVEGRLPHSFIPFSVGSRTCIGRPFAIVETKLALAMLLMRFRITLESDDPVEPEPLVTLRPRQGLVVRLAPVEGGSDR